MANHQNKYVWRNSGACLIGLLVIGSVLTASVGSTTAQSGLIPEKYLKISAGVSTRREVEKLFSKGDSKRHFVEYETDDFSVAIQYSLGSCELKQAVLGLPEWTVEEIFYNWPEARQIRLGDILRDRKRFEKRQIGDVVGHDYYVNDEWGISIAYDRKWKEVLSIRMRPPAALIEKYSCQKSPD